MGVVNIVATMNEPNAFWIGQCIQVSVWTFCSWVLVQRIRERLSAWHKVLMVLQVFCAFITVVDLIYVTAAQIPLYTPKKRRILVWFIFAGFSLLLALGAAYQGNFEVSDSLRKVPFVLAMFLTTLQVLIWVSFANLAGHMIVELEVQRLELAWTNG